MDTIEIQKYIKNRYPFLMVDRITEVVPGEYAHGYKNLTNNDWFFPCHYEGHMNMPGVIQIETLIEVFIIAVTTLSEYKGKRTSDVRLNNVIFKKEVTPGDRLDVIARVEKCKRGLASGKAIGYVDDEVACEAEVTIAIPDVIELLKPKLLNN